MAWAALSSSIRRPSLDFPNYRRFRRRVSSSPSNPGSRQRLRPMLAVPRIPSSPPTAPPGVLYQPFRPPPSPLPAKYRSLGTEERLEILRNRFGLWHEYAPLISSLSADGFTPPSIEEITGITGAEQNRFAVASQVRDSLISSSFSTDILPFFDASSSADLLYELRLLNAAQRVAAALHAVDRSFDPKGAQELARAIKDFPHRKGEIGWECFSAASPGDCLAYTDFRLSREVIAEEDRMAALEKAMQEAETESARRRIEEEMEKLRKGEDRKVGEMEKEASVTVPVVRLRYGEIAEATFVVLLPVCRAEEGSDVVEAAPWLCKMEGEMGVFKADKGWRRWVVLPGWEPAAAVGEGGLAVEFFDGRVLPWRKNRFEKEEAVLVVVNRKRNKVEEELDELYLVKGGEKKKGMAVESGKKLLETGRQTEAVGVVVLVVRPPKEEDDQLNDEDWE